MRSGSWRASGRGLWSEGVDSFRTKTPPPYVSRCSINRPTLEGQRESRSELKLRLCRDPFNCQTTHVGALTCMFKRDCAHVAIDIEVQDSVFIEVSGLSNIAITEFNVQSVGVFKVLNFHGLYPRSKNALWTVSRSDNRTTRRYRPSISSILAQRRTRPSA